MEGACDTGGVGAATARRPGARARDGKLGVAAWARSAAPRSTAGSCDGFDQVLDGADPRAAVQRGHAARGLGNAPGLRLHLRTACGSRGTCDPTGAQSSRLGALTHAIIGFMGPGVRLGCAFAFSILFEVCPLSLPGCSFCIHNARARPPQSDFVGATWREPARRQSPAVWGEH